MLRSRTSLAVALVALAFVALAAFKNSTTNAANDNRSRRRRAFPFAVGCPATAANLTALSQRDPRLGPLYRICGADTNCGRVNDAGYGAKMVALRVDTKPAEMTLR